MSKRCAKCEKTVYPLEELKCLDKIWHKTCFRCWECSMVLNMKNYKGYDKKPYCNAHYPKTKHTSVAETPEMARLAQNTKMQSQIKYHEDFEKNIKGTKIQVTDDPETQRLKASSALISQVEYKGLRRQAQEMEGHRVQIPREQHYPPPQHSMPPPQYNNAPAPQMAPPAQPMAPVQPPPPQPETVAPPPAAPASSGPIYQAMYDYEAQDEDEIGFLEHDLVIDCQPIDDGWMFGTIKRTGQRGMLPANYVERVQ